MHRIFLLYIFVDISKAISRKRCKIAGKFVLITNRESFSIGTKIGMTLNGEMALILLILPNLVVSGAHCVKLVDKAINYGQFTITGTM